MQGNASTMRSQHAHASFGRTCRITLKRAGTYSSISATSSPTRCIAPPQSGQHVAGSWFTVSRGRCSGSGLRDGGVLSAGAAVGELACAWLVSRASTISSS